MGEPAVAAFDFDGTLTYCDSLLPYAPPLARLRQRDNRVSSESDTLALRTEMHTKVLLPPCETRSPKPR